MSNDFCQAICHAFHLVQQFSPSGNVQFQPHADGHEKGFNHGPCHSQEVSSPGRTTEFQAVGDSLHYRVAMVEKKECLAAQ